MFIMTCRSSDREMFPLPSCRQTSVGLQPSYQNIYPARAYIVKYGEGFSDVLLLKIRVNLDSDLNRIHISYILHLIDLGSHHEEKIRELDEASGIFVDHVDEVLELLLRGVLPYQPADSWV